jgi:HEAT repeat protein
LGLFGPPDIAKLKAKGDIKGLVEALSYQKDPSVRTQSAFALGELNERIGQALERQKPDLFSGDWFTWESRHNAFLNVFAVVGQALCLALVDPDAHVRVAAVKALTEIGPFEVVGLPLTMALGDSDVSVREGAVAALSSRRSAAALPALIAALGNRESSVRRLAVDGIGHVPDTVPAHGQEPGVASARRAAVPALVAALGDADQGVRARAAGVLGDIGDSAAIEPLVGLLADEMVQVPAATALEALGWKPDDSDAAAIYCALRQQWDRCVELGSKAVLPLCKALDDPRPVARIAAAEALGRIGDEKALDRLRPLLGAGDMPVRVAAASAMARMGDRQAVECLLSTSVLISSASGAAVETLTGFLDRRAIEPLAAALSDQNVAVRAIAVKALEALSWEPDRGAAGAAFWMEKGDVGRCASLGEVAFEPLVAALGRPELSEAAATALVGIGSPVVAPLIAGFERSSETTRQSAALVLGRIGDPRAIDCLAGALESPSLVGRKAPAEALVMIYQAGRLDDEARRRILDRREQLTADHEDRQGHADEYEDRPNDCGAHTDSAWHQDSGIGVEFPV